GGGRVAEAMSLGKILRQKGLTAGVARTRPEACADAANEKDCKRLKSANDALESGLEIVGECDSACVYVLIGAKTRIVWPGSRLGVHTPRANAAVMAKLTPGQQKIVKQRSNSMRRAYVREMGIDGRLEDAVNSTPFEKIKYLTRDELADFGIDR